MRTFSWWLAAPILLFTACTRPEVEAFRLRPAPVVVRVNLPAGMDDRDGLAAEYAAVLRSRLASRVEVVPEGTRPPVGAAELVVDIRAVAVRPGAADPAKVGLAVGATVGALSAASGNRGWGVVDGLFWGLWAGTATAAHRERVVARLGFLPQAVSAQVRLVQAGQAEPLWVDAVEPLEMVEVMDPLPRHLRDDDGRIREEEARAFARVVVQKASAYFGWTRFREPRWYGGVPDPDREPSPRGDLPPTPPPTMTPPPPPKVLPPVPEPPKDPEPR